MPKFICVTNLDVSTGQTPQKRIIAVETISAVVENGEYRTIMFNKQSGLTDRSVAESYEWFQHILAADAARRDSPKPLTAV